MSLYRGRSRIELEIEKNRNEGNWRKVSDLINQLNIKIVSNDNLAAFLKNECALEMYLDNNAPNEKNIKKAINNLTDIKISLFNLMNSNYVKSNQPDIMFEAELLLAKIYYACGNEQEVMNIYKNLDINKTWSPINASIRTLGLVSELFAMNAFCLERKPPSFISKAGDQYNSDDDEWLFGKDNTERTGSDEIVNIQNNNPPSIFSSSYKRQLEQSCRDNWLSQIVNDLKLSIIFGYSYLQKKYTKVTNSGYSTGINASVGTGMSTALGSGSLYGGYGLSAANTADMIASPGIVDDSVSLRSAEKKTSRLLASRQKKKSKKISLPPNVKGDQHKKKEHGNKNKPVTNSKKNTSNLNVPSAGSKIDRDVLLIDDYGDDNVELSSFPKTVYAHTPTNTAINGSNKKDSFQPNLTNNSQFIYNGSTAVGNAQSTDFDMFESQMNEDLYNSYPSPPSGYVLEKAFLKLPIIFLKSGQSDKAIIVYRYQLSLSETKYTQNIRQVLCRQLAEVLIKGVCFSTYIPIQYSDVALTFSRTKRFHLLQELAEKPDNLPRTSLNTLNNKQTIINTLLSPNRTSRDSKDDSSHVPPLKLSVDALTSAFLSPALSLSSVSQLDPNDRLPLNARFSTLLGPQGASIYPLRHDLPRAFAPRFMSNEILLLTLICRSLANSSAILSLAPEHEEARSITAQDITRINDLLTLVLTFNSAFDVCENGVSDFNEKSAANLRRYKFLSTTLERSVKFNPERFHTWYRFAFSLYTFALSHSNSKSCCRSGGSIRFGGCLANNQSLHESKISSSTTLRERSDLYKTLRAFEECHAMRPENVTIILMICRICLEGLGDIDKSIDYARSAIDLCTSSTPSQRNDAYSNSSRQTTNPATQNNNNLGNESVFTSRGYSTLQLAKAYNSLGYSYFCKSQNSNIAYSYTQRIRYTQLALENFKKALNLDPQNMDFVFNLALQHAILRQLPQATKLVELCLVTELTHFPACHLLVLLKTASSFPVSKAGIGPSKSIHKKKLQIMASTDFVAIEDLRRGPDEKINLKQALELVNSLIQQCPHDFNLYFTKAEVELKYYGYEVALSTYRKMLNIWREIKDKYLDTETEYHNLLKKAEIKNKIDVYEKDPTPSIYGNHSTRTDPTVVGTQSDVISYSTRSSDLDRPREMNEFLMTQFQIWLKIAQVYLDENMLEDAFFALKEAEGISKTSYFTLDMWGKFYMSLGDPHTAKVYFESALASNPSYVDALQDLSLAYFYLQNFEMAEIKIREAIKINPTSHRSWYYLGHIYHMNINPDKDQAASDFYMTALDLYTSNALRPYDILKPIF